MIKNRLLEKERFTEEPYRIGYIFDEAPVETDWLIVTFSAIPAADSPIKHQYSFTRVTNGFPCHRLFLQDTPGSMGCYYLCQNLDFGYINTVSSLILRICEEHRIPRSHIITVGSSKGGTSSLIYALCLNAGHCITLVPQIKIGTFVRATFPDTFRFMIGNKTDSDGGEQVLNQVVFNALDNRRDTVLHLLTSRGDTQFADHIQPFLHALEGLAPPSPKDDTRNDILIDNRIQSHQDVSRFSESYITNKINEILSGKTAWDGIAEPYSTTSIPLDQIVINHKISVSGFDVTVTLGVSDEIQKLIPIPQFAFYLRDADKAVISRTVYSSEPHATFRIPNPGTYHIRYFVKQCDQKIAVSLPGFSVPAPD